jgi:hypothetical protein
VLDLGEGGGGCRLEQNGKYRERLGEKGDIGGGYIRLDLRYECRW